ncbi:MAG TPA: class I SAM-dependent methyltransferase [Rhodocyclaceae bacterium]|nr:class I SAM-dependent methyltransferase [Rhodocyclaceae bacterium]
MSDREPSRTALATAYLRAAHQLLDATPPILDDPVAVRLLGAGAAERIRAAAGHYRTPGALALRAHVVLRSRFAEDRLAAAVGRGVSQYLILGAGFDTFALRQPAWAQSLRIFEIDQPATQAAKRARLSESGLAMPANAAFADIDFERESLRAGLHRQRISSQTKTFFSWLGVTMYLSEAAIDAALQTMASFPSGSEVVLTFLQPSGPAAAASPLADRVAGIGEPFVSRFEPDALREKLLAAGFTQVAFLSSEEAGARYFAARPADLPVPGKTAIASAIR